MTYAVDDGSLSSRQIGSIAAIDGERRCGGGVRSITYEADIISVRGSYRRGAYHACTGRSCS